MKTNKSALAGVIAILAAAYAQSQRVKQAGTTDYVPKADLKPVKEKKVEKRPGGNRRARFNAQWRGF